MCHCVASPEEEQTEPHHQFVQVNVVVSRYLLNFRCSLWAGQHWNRRIMIVWGSQSVYQEISALFLRKDLILCFQSVPVSAFFSGFFFFFTYYEKYWRSIEYFLNLILGITEPVSNGELISETRCVFCAVAWSSHSLTCVSVYWWYKWQTALMSHLIIASSDESCYCFCLFSENPSVLWLFPMMENTWSRAR